MNPVFIGHLMYVGVVAIVMALIILAGYIARRRGGTR